MYMHVHVREYAVVFTETSYRVGGPQQATNGVVNSRKCIHLNTTSPEQVYSHKYVYTQKIKYNTMHAHPQATYMYMYMYV